MRETFENSQKQPRGDIASTHVFFNSDFDPVRLYSRPIQVTAAVLSAVLFFGAVGPTLARCVGGNETKASAAPVPTEQVTPAQGMHHCAGAHHLGEVDPVVKRDHRISPSEPSETDQGETVVRTAFSSFGAEAARKSRAPPDPSHVPSSLHLVRTVVFIV